MIAKNFSHPRSSNCESYICYKCCRETLCEGFIMGSEFEKQDNNIISIFLELLGFDDIIGFKSSMEEECHYFNKGSLWYGRRIGSKMMGFKEKIALMTANMFGSKGVLNYVLETSCVVVNQACGLNGLLHFLFVVAVDFAISSEVIKLLLEAFCTSFCLVAYC
nr:zinc finger ccch domain-containing protein 66 [Quercus suber]